MKKKLLAVLLSAVTALSVIACEGNTAATSEPAAEPAPKEEAEATVEEAEPTSIGNSVEGELTVTIWDEGQSPGLSHSYKNSSVG